VFDAAGDVEGVADQGPRDAMTGMDFQPAFR
jgi:hypothetical protein